MHRPIPIAAAFLMLTLAPIHGQGRGAGGQENIPSDLEIQQAAAAIEQADGYADIVAATTRYADVLSSPRVVEMVDALLKNPALNETQRGVLLLERQLSIDCRTLGAAAAARLLAVRVIAGSAIAADTPQQFAAVLEKFAPLASAINVELVRQALNTPGNNWPKPLLPLMEQLAIRLAEAWCPRCRNQDGRSGQRIRPARSDAFSETSSSGRQTDADRALAQHADHLRTILATSTSC